MILSRIQEYNKINETLKKISINQLHLYFKYQDLCSTKGVQGYVGVLEIKDPVLPSLKERKERKEKIEKKSRENVVFKFSRDIDFSTEHEAFILNEISKLKCPHVVGYYTLIEKGINKEFFVNNNKNWLDPDPNSIPYKVILMEYINTVEGISTLDKIVRGESKYLRPYNKGILHHTNIDIFRRNLVSSQLLQVLITLEILQDKIDFTHYDIHSDNIMEMECEPNSVIVYKYKNEFYLVPTYGFYPVIIDVGMSYCKQLCNKPLTSSLSNYKNGTQSTVFDPLNDVHHLIVSIMYDLELEEKINNEKDDNFEILFHSIANNIRNKFIPVPILIKKGWKQLPYDILDKLITKIKQISDVFDECIIDEFRIIDMLCHLIPIPFQTYENYETFKFPSLEIDFFIKEVQKLVNDDADIELFLICLKDIIMSINESNGSNGSNGSKEKFDENYSKTYSYKLGLKDFNSEKILKSANILSKQLSSNIYPLIKEHLEIINDGYDKIEKNFSSPIDMFHFIYQNLTPTFKINKDTMIYIWNTDEENNEGLSSTNCSELSQEVLDKINLSNRYNKGKLLMELIK